MNQSFTNWECLLGVETSNDNTEAIAKEYVEKDPRFKISITPKSGSCSATRNIGIDTTSGEYVIFLDGDDYLIENSLQRLYDKISARPGADLYPCAIQVENEMTGQYEELRDNYPQDFDKELTGAEATLFIHSLKRHPEPMMQLTICRRQFLLDHNLKCVYGLRGQDREFSPRALYWAKRVIPLHEPFYLYRKRIGSIVVSTSLLKKLQDQVIINKSLLAFHASVCKQPDFDKRLTICWGRSWSSWMFFWWFNPDYLKKISRADRLKTLEALFSDGFGDFKALLKGGALSRRIAGWWMRAFVRHPSMRYAAESFFRLYFHYCQ